jgi:putative two-component system hydrogenase maturation factor HypX/HoxX
MDAGDIWATQNFPMRAVSKSTLYRHEVTQAASEAVLRAVKNFGSQNFKPEPLNYDDPTVLGRWNDPIKRKDRAINWNEASSEIIKKIRAADSHPGVLENHIFDEPYFLFGAHQEDILTGKPGQIIAQREGAICIGSGDGSIWVSHLKKKEKGIKLKAIDALGDSTADIPKSPLSPFDTYQHQSTYREIWFEEKGDLFCFFFLSLWNSHSFVNNVTPLWFSAC